MPTEITTVVAQVVGGINLYYRSSGAMKPAQDLAKQVLSGESSFV